MSQLPSASPAAAPTPSAAGGASVASPRKWKVGTLAYTAAGLSALFGLLLWGDFGFFLKEKAVLPACTVLLNKFGASDFLVGLLISSLPQALSMILVPIVGYRSDRYRSRWGRRIPFLALTVPIACVAAIGLAFSPALGRLLDRALDGLSPGYHSCVVICLGTFWLLTEFSSVICTCLFHGLIVDVVPQAVIGRFYAMFRVVSLMAGMVFTWTLLGGVEQFYTWIFIGIAAVYGLSFTAMCLKVKEGQYPPVPAEAEGPREWAVGIYLRECFSKGYYRWIFLAVSLGYMSTWPISLYMYAFAPTVGMDLGTLGKYQTVQMFFSLLQSYPLGWLADKIHPVRVNLLTLLLLLVSTLLAFFLVHDARSLGIAVVVVGTLAGSWSTSMLALGPTLFPKAKFATMNSAMSICYSLGLMLVTPICGGMLDRMNHDYRYIYYWATLMTAAAWLATYVIYRRFVVLGGTKHYVAP